ncbi:MAG: transcription termination factor NusA [Bacillales bacterium]|nr:transcription termination factor NusA [Bacillales bacterium]
MIDLKILLAAFDELEADGVSREVTIQILKEAFESIFKKKNYEDTRVECDIKPVEGEINIYLVKTVVDEVNDDNIEISLEDAREVDSNIQVGDDFKTKCEIDDFTKADALRFKSVLRQKIKEAQKAAIYEAYSDKEGELITGVVEKIEDNFTLVNIGRTTVVLPDKHKIGEEQFYVGQTIKVYLTNVHSLSGGPKINVSRSDAGFLKRLFEEEIPEVFDGTVVVKDIARDAGERSKVSVYSTDPTVDPIGSCIGPGGNKIQKICAQLGREKIDIVQYHDYPGLFIAEALKPAQVLQVKLNEENKSAIAIVKNDDLRVAIGKRGINAVLAVKLTGWKIDIKEIDVALSEGIIGESIDEMNDKEALLAVERRRKELLLANERELKEIAARQEAKAQEKLEEVAPVEVEEYLPVEEEIEETPVEETPDEEKVEETPVEENVEEKVEEKVEEVKVEYNPVHLQPKTSLADLEKQIEEEKKQAKQVQPSKRKPKKEEVIVKPVPQTPGMSIYTDEELEEMDYEDEEEENTYDDDVDYSDYDKYYED